MLNRFSCSKECLGLDCILISAVEFLSVVGTKGRSFNFGGARLLGVKKLGESVWWFRKVSPMKMSFPNDHGPWESNSEYKGGDVPSYPSEIPPYGGLWDPHHCLAGQNPPLGGYPDIITAFNSELVWQRQQCGGLVSSRLSRNGSPNNPTQSQKKTRRRVATIAQRRAANIRERRRMFNLNEAFDKLRRKVPTFAYEKRLSRIETLRLAITYISFMTELLHGTSPDLKGNDIYPQREYIPYGLIN